MLFSDIAFCKTRFNRGGIGEGSALAEAVGMRSLNMLTYVLGACSASKAKTEKCVAKVMCSRVKLRRNSAASID